MIRLRFSPPADDDVWDEWIADGAASAAGLSADSPRMIDADLYKRERPRLLAAAFGKCAYCEVRLAPGQRSGDVEHWRPKARVRDRNGKQVQVVIDGTSVNHPGYYWLAYSWENLLPACSACNRRAGDAKLGYQTGKGEIFPTLDATWAHEPDRIDSEKPGLLNPWFDNPEDHLFFDPDTGLVVGLTERGRVSEKILGLNRDGVPEARLEAVDNVERTLSHLGGDAVRGNVNDADLRLLKAVVDGSATYSAVCRTALRRGRERVTAQMIELDV